MAKLPKGQEEGSKAPHWHLQMQKNHQMTLLSLDALVENICALREWWVMEWRSEGEKERRRKKKQDRLPRDTVAAVT